VASRARTRRRLVAPAVVRGASHGQGDAGRLPIARSLVQGSVIMRLYDFGFIILVAGIAAAVALVVASQVA
jgi:hypothetical protein